MGPWPTHLPSPTQGKLSSKITASLKEQINLNKGDFSLKAATFGGKDPPTALSADVSSINVTGIKGFPREDLLPFDISELSFAKKNRRKKPSQHQNVIPSKLTSSHCVSKVAEIFDLTGKFTPITATMQMDRHKLVKRSLAWDDTVLDELQPILTPHFEMMKEIWNLKFHRVVIHANAVNLNIHTICTANVSNQITCAAIYATFLRRNESYSMQLIFSRSKIISDGLS